jgi:HK97 family phage portal protein
MFPRLQAARRKSFEIFNGLFDYGAGSIRNGFYPVQIGGIAAPPVNIARTDTGDYQTPMRSLELSAVWACVWLIADTISTLPFNLNKRTGNNTWGKPFRSTPAYQVIGQQPNQYMTAPEFWQFMIASDLLWGNAYALKTVNANGDLIALQSLLPQFMVPYRRQDTGEMRYKYVPTGLMNEPQQDWSLDQIFHMKDRSLDGLVGMSRIQYARNSLGISRAAEMGVSDTFRNGMKSGGFLMYDRVMKPEQRKVVQESLQKFKTGGAESSGFMVLEAGMQFQTISMPPQDAQLLSTRQFGVEDVCRWFGVPPVLIGHAAAGVTSWGSGIEQLLLGFQSLTLRPYIRKLEASVVKSLLPPEQRATVYLTIDTNDLLGADSVARSTLYASAGQNGWMTRNEIRSMEDLPPMDGGDSLTVQSNLIPLDQLGQTPAQPGKPDVPVIPAGPPPPKQEQAP